MLSDININAKSRRENFSPIYNFKKNKLVFFVFLFTFGVIFSNATGVEAATAIYRSVAPSATSALDTGSADSNTLSIAGSTATFSIAVPNNVGVGDAIQYDSDNNGSIDAVAFIHGRTSSTVFTVKNAAGGTPTATSADDIDWSTFRAYTSFFNAEAGTENTGLDDAIENFDTHSGGKAITTADEQWNFAMYGNGTTADSALVVFDGWTTDVSRYVRIYTATSTAEVGATQRHAGVWDTSKYYFGTNASVALDFRDSFIWMDGIQIEGTSTTASQAMVNLGSGTGTTTLSNNLIRKSVIGGTSNSGIQLTLSSSYAYIYNNIIHNLSGASATGIIDASGSGVFAYIYNNTIASTTGANGVGANLKTFGRAVLKNNLFSNVTIAASGTYAVGTNYNATNNASMGANYTVTGGGNANDRVGQTFTFTDVANRNFHLAVGDAGAKDVGVDLSADLALPFNKDVDGETRTGSWDIGADEYVVVDSVPPVRSAGSPSGTQPYGTTGVTLSLTTDEGATCKYGTVGGTAYASIASTFGSTGGTSHTQSITGLTNGSSYSYYVRCSDALSNVNTDDYTITFDIEATDATAPTVSITTPTNNSYVSGNVTVTASASDNDSLAGVQFKLDTNTFIGSEDTSAPYTISWDSSAVSEGAHTLIAVARDVTGNRATSTAITVTANNIPPVVTLTSPANGATVRGNTPITYTASATTSPECSINMTRWVPCLVDDEIFFSQLPGWNALSTTTPFTLYLRDTNLGGITATSTVTGLMKARFYPPVGIPAPSFGINETVANVYGSADYYTYWIDNTNPAATDTANASGTPTLPRMTIPSTLTLGPGDVVQIRGGPYVVAQDRFSINAEGTAEAPIFITGVGATTTPVLQKWVHFKRAKYMIFEGFDIQPATALGGLEFRPDANGVEIHHNAVRYVETSGTATSTTNTLVGHTMSVNNTTYDTAVHDIVFYENVSHDSGNWQSATEDDNHSFTVGEKVQYTWYLDNVAYRSSGDGIQVSHNANYTSHHIYIGRNLFYKHRENGVDIKEADDVIVSSNTMHTFRSSPTSEGAALVVHYDPSRIWLLNNTIYDAQFGIVSTGVAANFHVIGNLIYNITKDPATVENHASTSVHRYGSGIYWYSTATTSAINNTIYNTGTGISADLQGYGATIENNIISNINTADSDYHMIYTGSVGLGQSSIRNNLLYQAGMAVQNVMGVGTCTNCLESDPLFTTAGSDFTLQSSSPAKNAGSTQVFSTFQSLYSLDISRDIASTTRPRGSAWDIGAYEYIESADVTAPVISAVASSTATTTATITWTTDELATSTVQYGTTISYGTATSSDVLATSHSIYLINLTPDTLYHFKVASGDPLFNFSSSTDYTFTTSAVSAPTLTTQAVSSITTTTSIGNGTITATGNLNPTVRGFVYGATTAYGATTTSSGDFSTGAFTGSISSLTCATTYHIAPYATNSQGTSYGSDTTFTTSDCAVESTPTPTSGGSSSSSGSRSTFVLVQQADGTYVFVPRDSVLANQAIEIANIPEPNFIERLFGEGEPTFVPEIVPTELDLSELPTEVVTLAGKFPSVMKMLENIAKSGGNLLSKLKNIKFTLPTIGNNVPIESLTSTEKKSIPTEVVFAKSNDLIDYSVSLSITEDGNANQVMHTLAGKEINLALKPDFPVKEIKGYLMVSKLDRRSAKTIPANSLVAAPILALFTQSHTAKENIVPETNLVLDSFSYTDSDKDGIYTASIDAPLVHGEYDIMTIVTYKNIKLGSKELHLITVIDPEGYIYTKKGGLEARLPDVKVYLFVKNPQTGVFEIWSASKYKQVNPQKTDNTGTYSFLVPEGTYKLTVSADGYYDYAGDEFTVIQGSGVHENVELQSKHWWTSLWRWFAGLFK